MTIAKHDIRQTIALRHGASARHRMAVDHDAKTEIPLGLGNEVGERVVIRVIVVPNTG